MTMPARLRSIAIVIAILSTGLTVAGCSDRKETAAYQAACQGPPLRSVEKRNKAMEDGYDINRRYDCIDKASFAAISEQKARWEAANTPEARAQREAERARKLEEQARSTAAADSHAATPPAPVAPAPLVRCTSADGKSSTLRRGPCAPGDTQTLVTPNRALMERSDANKGLIKCTSRDGTKVSIQRGNCASPDDYQQPLGDR